MNNDGAEVNAGRLMLASLETPTLTKAELAEMLFDKLGLNKRESKDMVDAFFVIVHGTLVSGDDVKLSGFGNFNIRRKAPRPTAAARASAQHRLPPASRMTSWPPMRRLSPPNWAPPRSG